MEWHKVKDKRPPPGEWIWIWSVPDNSKQLIRYMGSQEQWEETRNDPNFPVWAHLNNEKEASDG